MTVLRPASFAVKSDRIDSCQIITEQPHNGTPWWMVIGKRRSFQLRVLVNLGRITQTLVVILGNW